jgi:hypothetical protein
MGSKADLKQGTLHFRSEDQDPLKLVGPKIPTLPVWGKAIKNFIDNAVGVGGNKNITAIPELAAAQTPRFDICTNEPTGKQKKPTTTVKYKTTATRCRTSSR